MSKPPRPNVLLFMSDQHHPRFMRCAGEPLVHTPAFDALAAGGVRMSSAYCSFPLCGPSRMSFLTARLASRIGCLDNAAQLGSDIPTFAHAFLAGGYETVLSGRMHMVGPDQRHGFERRLIGDCTTAHVNVGWKLEPVLGELRNTTGYSRHGILTSGPGRTGYHAYDQAVTRTTIDWLRDRGRREADRPFLLVVGTVSPHCPFVAPPDDFFRYYDRIREEDLPTFDPAAMHPVHRAFRLHAKIDPEPLPIEAQRRARAAYYGLCTFTDRLFGQVIETLHDGGMAENTIVAYTSDHGEMIGEHGLWWKSTFFEGSAGVPLLVSWPGRIGGGRVAPQCVSLMDIGPTMLDLAGLDAMPCTDGRSFRPLLEGDAGGWPDEVLVENFATSGDLQPQRMVRRGSWKLCYYHGQSPQLFNVAEDPDETRDRAGDPACRPIVAELLAAVMKDWDPQEMHRRRQCRAAEAGLIAAWTRRMDPPEPDPLWFDAPQENCILPCGGREAPPR